MGAERDLLVVGAGTLGARVAADWRGAFTDATVVGETRSDARHEALQAAGVVPRRRDGAPDDRFPNVLFAVPPSALPDRDPARYRAEAERAVRLWNGDGRLVMTSSTAVYAVADGGWCAEGAPLVASPRTEGLLAAEAPVLAAGGCVVRLAGLYDATRGPHRVYLRTKRSPRRPDGWLNLVHYDDAAALCRCVLEAGVPGEVYMGCDGAPLRRQELVAQAVAAGLAGEGVEFTGREGPLGRRCDNTATRRALGWAPRVASFGAWLSAEASGGR